MIFLPLLRQFEFEDFCKSVDFNIIENGLFFGSDWKFDELRAPYNRLYIVLEGEGVILHGEDKHVIQAGYAYIVPAYYGFACYTPRHLKKIYSHFTIHRLFDKGMFENTDEILRMKIDTKEYEPYYDALINKDTSLYYSIKGAYTFLIYSFISRYDIDSFESDYLSLSPQLKKLYDLLKINITAKTKTADLAAYLNLSQSMLSKIYKFETGHTLKWFLQQKLIQKAQLLLATTSKSITQIAYELEYDDPLYFSRMFKKWSGDSPRVYREKHNML